MNGYCDQCGASHVYPDVRLWRDTAPPTSLPCGCVMRRGQGQPPTSAPESAASGPGGPTPGPATIAFTRKQKAPITFVRCLDKGDRITHQGVTYEVVHVNKGKGRVSIEPVRGVVRVRGQACVVQEVEAPCSERS